MPSTVKNVYELGFIDPYQTTNKDQNKWFKDIVLGNIEAYNEADAAYKEANAGVLNTATPTAGYGVGTGLGTAAVTGAPKPPKYYFWLVNDLLKQTGETDPLTAWQSLSADEKDKLVADVGTRAMKDENSGSFLGNLLIKPTTPLSLIGPFNAIPGAAAGSAVAGVGITASGGIGTVLSDPLIGELGTGIITGGSGAGTLGGGSTEKPDYPEPPEEGPQVPADEKETWWEKRGYPTREAAVADGWRWRYGKLEKVDPVEEEETPIVAPDKDDPRPDREDPPPIVNVPGVEPGQVGDEEEENPPVVVPGGNDPPPTPEPPSNPFDAAIGNMGIFHGQAGASRKPYVNVKPPGEQDAPTIQHSDLVQNALNEAGVPSRGTSQRQRPAQGLGIVEGVLPQKTPQNESEDEDVLSKIRRRRRGLGIG